MSEKTLKSIRRVGYALWRAALRALPSVVGILIVVFLLLQMVPGDAADVLAGESGGATADTLAALRAKFGLDQPILLQLLAYLNNLAHFNLGYSIRYNASVLDLILGRLPHTLVLMAAAQVVAVFGGLVVGALMAARAGKWTDRLLSLVSLVFYSTPSFWIGLMSLIVFSVWLGWFPSGGNITIGADLHGWAYLVDYLRHAVLPVLSLGFFFLSIYARLTRSAMLEIARQDFVRTAHAKGLHPLRVIVRHVLRCALLPVTTVAGMHFGAMLGGAAVIETVFSWPGLGRLALEAVLARDFSVLMGILLFSSFLVILTNVLVDVLQAWLDPRIKLA
jgi:peptide/nickel transport system permease protein